MKDRFEELHGGKTIPAREREIKKLLRALMGARQDLPKVKDKRWQEAYRHATEEVQIVEVVGHLLGKHHSLHKLQRELVNCPFHDDGSPSMKLYPASNTFHCFGCGAHGSPIDFVMRHHGYDFKQAVEFLFSL